MALSLMRGYALLVRRTATPNYSASRVALWRCALSCASSHLDSPGALAEPHNSPLRFRLTGGLLSTTLLLCAPPRTVMRSASFPRDAKFRHAYHWGL